jgi:hypothetical protein
MALPIISLAVQIAAIAAQGSIPGEGATTLAIVSATATLDGARFAIFRSEADVASALTATEILAADASRIRAALGLASPASAPTRVVIIRKAGGESYAEALAAAETAGMGPTLAGYLWLAIDSRVAADIDGAGTFAANGQRCAVLVAQSASADWLTSSLPAGFSERGNTIILYHPTDAQIADVVHAAGCAGIRRVGDRPAGRQPLDAIAAYPTGITAAQRTFLRANNANEIRQFRYGSSLQAVENPISMAGKTLSVLASTRYLQAVTRDAVERLLASVWSTGSGIDTSPTGIGRITGAIDAALSPLVQVDIFPDADRPAGWVSSASVSGTTLSVSYRINGQADVGAVDGILYYEVQS